MFGLRCIINNPTSPPYTPNWPRDSAQPNSFCIAAIVCATSKGKNTAHPNETWPDPTQGNPNTPRVMCTMQIQLNQQSGRKTTIRCCATWENARPRGTFASPRCHRFSPIHKSCARRKCPAQISCRENVGKKATETRDFMPPYLHQLGEKLVDKATGLIPRFRSTRWKTSRVMWWCRIFRYCQICARNKWGKHDETLTVNVGTLPFSVCCALSDVLFDRYTDLLNVAFYLTYNLAYILMFFQHSTWHSYMTYIFWHSSIFSQIYFCLTLYLAFYQTLHLG